jgi:hypothetical protein
MRATRPTAAVVASVTCRFVAIARRSLLEIYLRDARRSPHMDYWMFTTSSGETTRFLPVESSISVI